MKKWHRITLIICCLLGMGISFAYYLRSNYDSFDEIKAPVHVNIEIEKTYAPSVLIAAHIESGNKLFTLSSGNSNETRTVVLYSEIEYGKPFPPFIRKLFLRIPQETVQETINAIDSISIFIGNKTFYFSHSDIVNLQGMEQDDYMLYELQGLEYEKSIILTLLKMPQWINWYGDFNLAVKAASAFFIHPEKFIITWCFLVCLLFLCWSTIKNIYSAMRKQKLPLPELLLLGCIVLAGFILRLNGYVRYSSWSDELYSACRASNPALPFMSAFGDPGNPPLYFILLRLWFMLFGWTEQSGRFFSVIIGTAAIISLYFMVKRFTNKKAAFLAAAYMAVNSYFIGFSQEMRPYILEVFLVSIVAFKFLIIIQKSEMSFIDLIWYIIPSVLLVNTHYYGSLFVLAAFLFHVFFSIYNKTFSLKKTVIFFTGNLITALSLLPYFIHTAFQRALLDSSFNTWIGKPGLKLLCITAIIPLSGIVYIYLRKTVFKKILNGSHSCFLDYSFFVMSAVYLIAFGISLYRPILTVTYLIILFPLLFAIVAIILTSVFTNSSKLIGGLCIGFAFIWIAGGYEADRGGNTSVYKESQSYISKDAEAHLQNTSTEILSWASAGAAHFYGYKELPLYVPGNNQDILYFDPIIPKEELYSKIDAMGIGRDRILQIHITRSSSVVKIYLRRDGRDN